MHCYVFYKLHRETHRPVCKTESKKDSRGKTHGYSVAKFTQLLIRIYTKQDPTLGTLC